METLQLIGVVLGSLAVIITSLGVIWSKVFGRFIARPIAQAVRREFEEAIEQIVVQQIGSLPTHIGKALARIELLERDVDALWERTRNGSSKKPKLN